VNRISLSGVRRIAQFAINILTLEKAMPLDSRRSRRQICLALLALFCAGASADENDEIVTGCHYSNAEWGFEAIDRCIKDNQSTRALVLQYPAKYKRIVDRCRRESEFGWSWVKTCVDRDIEAESALAQYPKERAGLIDACYGEFGGLGAARVKACVDQLIETPGSPTKN